MELNTSPEAQESAQWLEARVVLTEKPGLIPSMHMVIHNPITPVSGDRMPSSAFLDSRQYFITIL